MYTLEGVSTFANFITAYEEFQLNRDYHFLSCIAFFAFKGNFLTSIIIIILVLALKRVQL